MASSNFCCAARTRARSIAPDGKCGSALKHRLVFGGCLRQFLLGFEERAEGVVGAGGVRLLGNHGAQLFRRALAIAALHQGDREIVASFPILGVETQRGLE